MKTLYILRHAKSDWNGNFTSDFDRGLNARGLRDAPFMGKVLKNLGVSVDLILSSDATRAKSTIEFIAKEIGYDKEKIVFEHSIYEASTTTIINLIKSCDDKIDSLMLIGHNPSLTSVINQISNVTLDNLPTIGIMSIEFDIDSWSEIEPYSGKMKFFEYPKKHQ
jgi:phosphohistidine phosphatase